MSQPHHPIDQSPINLGESSLPRSPSGKELLTRVDAIYREMNNEGIPPLEKARRLPDLLILGMDLCEKLLIPPKVNPVYRYSWKLVMKEDLGAKLPRSLQDIITKLRSSFKNLHTPVNHLLDVIESGLLPTSENLTVHNDASFEGLRVPEVGAMLRRRMEVFGELETFVNDAIQLRKQIVDLPNLYTTASKIIPSGDINRQDFAYSIAKLSNLCLKISNDIFKFSLTIVNDFYEQCFSVSTSPEKQEEMQVEERVADATELVIRHEDVRESFSQVEREINERYAALLISEDPSLASLRSSLVATREFLGLTIASLKQLELVLTADNNWKHSDPKNSLSASLEASVLIYRYYFARNSLAVVAHKMLQPSLSDVFDTRTDTGVTNDARGDLDESVHFVEKIAPQLINCCLAADGISNYLHKQLFAKYISEKMEEINQRMDQK